MDSRPSYVHGASPAPLIGETIGAHFDRIAAKHAPREALVVRHQDVRWSWAELKRRVDNLACGLRRLGLAPGERIGIWSQNCAEWVLTQFATAKAGLILVNINPAYRRSELEYALNKVQCKALILSPGFKTSNYIEILQSVALDLKSLAIVIRLGRDKTPGMLNFDDLLVDASDAEVEQLEALGPRCSSTTRSTSSSPRAPPARPRAPPSPTTTSSTTATSSARRCASARRTGCASRCRCTTASAWCSATSPASPTARPWSTPTAASTPRACSRRCRPSAAPRCTACRPCSSPCSTTRISPSYDLSTLRTGIMAGSPCPVEVMKRVAETMNMREVTIAYGMTETSPVSFQSSVDDPLERRVSTVGRIQPHIEVKIVDAEGRVVPRGEKGELLTRGYSVMLGYWNDEEKTREAIDAAGWMHTGDLATIDAAGYCNIVGRSKDMVIRGGENIYPREIEEFLYRHPKVQDVQCVGVPDDKYGEELCACVVLRAGMSASEDEIREFCRGQIAHYKIPRYVRFVDSFPMTVTGKIQKYLLRQQMADEMGLKAQKAA